MVGGGARPSLACGMGGGVSRLARNIEEQFVRPVVVGGGVESLMALGMDGGISRNARDTLFLQGRRQQG